MRTKLMQCLQLLACLSMLLISTQAQAIYIRPVKMNWPNFGTMPPCVPVDEVNEQTTYSVQVRIGGELLPTHAPMYVNWSAMTSFDAYSGSIGPLTWSDFSFEQDVNGHPVYLFITMLNLDFSNSCAEGGSEFELFLTGALTTSSGSPIGGAYAYPIGDYPDLFPETVFEQIYYDLEEKEACCLQSNSPASGGAVTGTLLEETPVLGVGPLVKEALRMTPNPFNDKVRVQVPANFIDPTALLKVEAYNSHGQLVYRAVEGCCEATEFDIDTSVLAPGTYFWRVEAGQEVQVLKSIKF